MALHNPAGYALAACCIQARLLCNLLDGMVAVEHGKGSKDGALFNEVPDRIADSVFLAGAGYAFSCPEAGLAAALCACLTAYLPLWALRSPAPSNSADPWQNPTGWPF